MGDMSREPSMEDILSSIRRVIARDETQIQARMARTVPRADSPGDDPISDAPIYDPASLAASPTASADERSAGEDPLICNHSAEAARNSLDALSAAFVQAPAANPASRTVDDMVMMALRPMLKDWLDSNLPPIVEAMVAKEIARITGRD